MSEFYKEFYIIQLREDWYQLRLVRTHFCISCGSNYQRLLEIITKWCAKFKTVEDMYLDLLKCDHKGHVGANTFNRNRAEYFERSHVFDEDIEDAVRKGLEEKKQSRPVLKNKKRFKVLTPTMVKEEPPVVEEDKAKPKVIKRLNNKLHKVNL